MSEVYVVNVRVVVHSKHHPDAFASGAADSVAHDLITLLEGIAVRHKPDVDIIHTVEVLQSLHDGEGMLTRIDMELDQ